MTIEDEDLIELTVIDEDSKELKELLIVKEMLKEIDKKVQRINDIILWIIFVFVVISIIIAIAFGMVFTR